MLTLLHTPADLPRVNAVIDAADWRPGPAHAYAAVSEHTARDWRRRLPAVAVVPNGIDLRHWRPRRGRSPGPTWPSGPPGSRRRRACRSPSRRAGPPGCGWPSPARSPLRPLRPRRGAAARRRRLRTWAISPTASCPRLIRRGRVFVSSPRWPEPFGLALVEAMACGTPAAALPAGAAAEVVAPTGGVLAAESSVAALADAIRQATTLDRHGGPGQRAPLRPPPRWSARTRGCCSTWSTPLSDPRATRSTTPLAS